MLETRFNEGPYLAGDEYSIADITTFPWVGCLDWDYKAADELKLQQDFPKVMAWYARCTERPASVRGAKVCPF